MQKIDTFSENQFDVIHAGNIYKQSLHVGPDISVLQGKLYNVL